MTTQVLKLPLQGDLTLNDIAPVAMELFPYMSQSLINHVVHIYRDQVAIARCFESVSDEFIAVCIWFAETNVHKPIRNLNSSAIGSEMARLTRCFEANKTLEIKSDYDTTVPVSYDMIERHNRTIARKLSSQLNIDESSGTLVRTLGSGHERNNYEALVVWVRNTIMSYDLPGHIDVLEVLSVELEKALQRWSTDRFS